MIKEIIVPEDIQLWHEYFELFNERYSLVELVDESNRYLNKLLESESWDSQPQFSTPYPIFSIALVISTDFKKDRIKRTPDILNGFSLPVEHKKVCLELQQLKSLIDSNPDIISINKWVRKLKHRLDISRFRNILINEGQIYSKYRDWIKSLNPRKDEREWMACPDFWMLFWEWGSLRFKAYKTNDFEYFDPYIDYMNKPFESTGEFR